MKEENMEKKEVVLFISILPSFVFNSAAAAASTPALPENLRGGLN